MVYMRCRKMIDDNGIKRVVFFGSYGKNVIAQRQEIEIINDETLISGTTAYQDFSLSFKNISQTTIHLFNQNGVEYITYNIDDIGEHFIEGNLGGGLSKITLMTSNFDPLYPIELILKEKSNSKPGYLWNPFDYEHTRGQQQAAGNFNNGSAAIAEDLNQKLSVIRSELWHNISFGLPLLSNLTSKSLIDTAIADMVLNQSDVSSISSFSSRIIQKEYHADIEVQTSFGNISLSI